MTIPRLNFSKNFKGKAVEPLPKPKSINKIKALESIYEQPRLVKPPMHVVNARIEEYVKRQNTKEYLNSFLYLRRRIETLIDEGYHVKMHDPKERNYLQSFAEKDSAVQAQMSAT